MIIKKTKEINGVVYDYAYSDSGYINGIYHNSSNNSNQHRPSVRADFGGAIMKGVSYEY